MFSNRHYILTLDCFCIPETWRTLVGACKAIVSCLFYFKVRGISFRICNTFISYRKQYSVCSILFDRPSSTSPPMLWEFIIDCDASPLSIKSSMAYTLFCRRDFKLFQLSNNFFSSCNVSLLVGFPSASKGLQQTLCYLDTNGCATDSLMEFVVEKLKSVSGKYTSSVHVRPWRKYDSI